MWITLKNTRHSSTKLYHTYLWDDVVGKKESGSYYITAGSPIVPCKFWKEILWTVTAWPEAIWLAWLINHDIAGIAAAAAQSVSWTGAARKAVEIAVTTHLCIIGECRLWTFGLTVRTVLNMSTGITLVIALHKHSQPVSGVECHTR